VMGERCRERGFADWQLSRDDGVFLFFWGGGLGRGSAPEGGRWEGKEREVGWGGIKFPSTWSS